MQLRQNLNNHYQELHLKNDPIFKKSSNSLVNFLTTSPGLSFIENLKKGRALEIGSGPRSAFEELKLPMSLEAMDLSDYAVRIGNENESSCVDYIQGNILELLELNSRELILDGHCLHCLTDLDDYKKALQNIKCALGPSGLFFWETMISHKGLEFSVEENLLWDQNQALLLKSGRPHRILMNAFDLEKLLVALNFRIEYFYIFNHKRMIPLDSRHEVKNGDPQLLRIIARG